MKKVFSLAAAAVMAMSMLVLTACGVDKDKVKGDWIVDTIGGKAVADWAAEQGAPEIAGQVQFSIGDDKTTVSTNDGNKQELDSAWRSDGVELKDGDTVKYALKLDEDKSVLTTKLDFGTGAQECVLKKGTFDFNAASQDAANAIAEDGAVVAEDGAEVAEDGAAPAEAE